MSRAALLLLALFCGASCGDPGPAEPQLAASTAPAADAFCSEHGVAEAVCTKCNPKLIAIFQAKGDWCAEHGFPESFCPLCHPERGGRPAANLGTGPPATGVRVQLADAETARRAGIEVVEAQAESAPSELAVVGTIAYDATRRAEVNARARGIVREVLVEVGQVVEAGAPLVRIESAEIGATRKSAISRSASSRWAHASKARARIASRCRGSTRSNAHGTI